MGSKPLEMSAFDWKSVGWVLLTSAIAAVLTAVVDSVLPDLKEKGVIDAAAFTILTTLIHAFRKYLTDTRVLRLVLVAAILAIPSVACAQNYGGLTAQVIDGNLLTNLIHDPMMMGIVMLIVSLLTSKFLKIDLTPFLLPIINSLFKPTTPATPPPVTTPTVPATPFDLPTLIQLILSMLNKARAEGDPAGEEAALLLLNRLSGRK